MFPKGWEPLLEAVNFKKRPFLDKVNCYLAKGIYIAPLLFQYINALKVPPNLSKRQKVLSANEFSLMLSNSDPQRQHLFHFLRIVLIWNGKCDDMTHKGCYQNPNKGYQLRVVELRVFAWG